MSKMFRESSGDVIPIVLIQLLFKKENLSAYTGHKQLYDLNIIGYTTNNDDREHIFESIVILIN